MVIQNCAMKLIELTFSHKTVYIPIHRPYTGLNKTNSDIYPTIGGN